jgi:hypothetical protein
MYANMPDLEEASSGSEDEVLLVEAAGHTSEDMDRMWWAFSIQREYCEAFASAIRFEPQISTIIRPTGHTSEDIDGMFRAIPARNSDTYACIFNITMAPLEASWCGDDCIYEAAKYHQAFASAIPRQVYLKVPPFFKLLLPDTFQSKSRFLFGCLAHLIKTGVFRWIYIDFRRPCDRFFSVCVWLEGKEEGAHKKHGPQRS